jgi:hypothetical protein
MQQPPAKVIKKPKNLVLTEKWTEIMGLAYDANIYGNNLTIVQD